LHYLQPLPPIHKRRRLAKNGKIVNNIIVDLDSSDDGKPQASKVVDLTSIDDKKTRSKRVETMTANHPGGKNPLVIIIYVCTLYFYKTYMLNETSLLIPHY
jgi:hypothetical protein